MDITKALKVLYAEKKRVDLAIASLEAKHPASKKRRGRKFIGVEKRRLVAGRMKKYWAQRRAELTSAGLPVSHLIDSPERFRCSNVEIAEPNLPS